MRDRDKLLRDDEGYELVEPLRAEVEVGDAAAFDRVAFTMSLLERLAPRNIRLVVYERRGGLHVERGRDGRVPWALVGVSPSASRDQIARRLASLFGLGEEQRVVESLLSS